MQCRSHETICNPKRVSRSLKYGRLKSEIRIQSTVHSVFSHHRVALNVGEENSEECWSRMNVVPVEQGSSDALVVKEASLVEEAQSERRTAAALEMMRKPETFNTLRKESCL